MDMSGEYRIAAPRAEVWQGLNDPDVLRQSIPGCESVERLSDTDMTATVTAKVGPVKARFKGRVMLANLNPPESYTISGEGSGGPAGFAKGSADVHLTEAGGATIMRYEVHANIGGKLAQLGGRLIDSTAKKMADDFFQRFAAVVESRAGGSPTAGAPYAAGPGAPSLPPNASLAPGAATSPDMPVAAMASDPQSDRTMAEPAQPALEMMPTPSDRVAAGIAGETVGMAVAAEVATERRGQGSVPDMTDDRNGGAATGSSGASAPLGGEPGDRDFVRDPSPAEAGREAAMVRAPIAGLGATGTSPTTPAASDRRGLSPAVWIGGLIVIVVVLVLIASLS